ncbi:MAG: hypothetical protein GY820_07525 [Gammaproteobacteria bacterium]|nr:hypothetical protein [Gammaproteobacteria bacterium]
MATGKKKYKLSEALVKLANEKLTGTLICVNEQSLQGRIFVKSGNVLMARCRNYEGLEALEIIQQHPLTLLKFHSNKNLVSLEYKGKQSAASSGDSNSSKSRGTEASSKIPEDISLLNYFQNEPRFNAAITAELRGILAEELNEQMGPLAEVLVSELPEGVNLVDAINTLSQDIGDQDLSRAFIDAVKARI